MKSAKWIKRMEGWKGDARVYELSEPFEYKRYGGDDAEEQALRATHLIVSAAVIPYSGPETYVFHAKADGSDVEHWTEIEGSMRGELDHGAALRRIGYEPEGCP